MANPIRGTSESDVIEGTSGADEIRGLGGADTIYGFGGGDVIFGGAGSDRISAGEDDTVSGGAGADTILARNLSGDFEIRADGGDDVILLDRTSPLFSEHALIDGGKGFDTIVIGSQDILFKVDVVSVERFLFDQGGYELRAREDQIFDAAGRMKVEVVGADGEADSQRLTIATSDGVLDASKLSMTAWDANDLIELWGDVGDDSVTGSLYADVLLGWSGNDTLDGGGGADLLRGGSGEDVFVIDAGSGPDAIDTIDDFEVGLDHIRLEGHDMAARKIGEKAFHVGTEAADRSDRLIYDRDSGALFFDRDGSGSDFEAVKIGQLDAGLDLTHRDFLLG